MIGDYEPLNPIQIAGATTVIKTAVDMPVDAICADETGGTLTITVSKDNFVTDNRVVGYIAGVATQTASVFLWVRVQKGEKVKMVSTGTQAFVRFNGPLQ
jgi:hypothetical protein